MILAAGRGERMRPLTDRLPKPLLKIGGKTLLGWHLERLAEAGIAEVVINVSWQGDLLMQALGDGSEYGLHISYSDEKDQALETAGGILKALPLLGSENFLVVNGDVFCDHPLSMPGLEEGMLAHLLMVPNPSHNPAGDFALHDGLLGSRGARLTYSGIGIYSPKLFAGMSEKIAPLAPLLKRAIAAGRVSGELWTGDWHDIGTPERFRALATLKDNSTDSTGTR